MSDRLCIVCHESNIKHIQYFKCTKYHNLCRLCFNKLKIASNICPLCRSSPIIEAKNPGLLTPMELFKIDVKKIDSANIYIHQYFTLPPDTKPIDIYYDNNKISLYMRNGNLAMFGGMFIGTNGFLYSYDEKYNRYYLSIHRAKFQFWDINRISIDFS